MRKGGAAAIIVLMMSASVALAGPSELTSPWPQDVRVNINVAEMAEVSIEGPVVIDGTLGEDPSTYGDAPVYANANFDYQISLQWEPLGSWTHEVHLGNSYVGAPVGMPGHVRLLQGNWDALEPIEDGRVRVEATPDTAGDPAEIDPGFAGDAAAVYYGGDVVGTVHVTLTHQ